MPKKCFQTNSKQTLQEEYVVNKIDRSTIFSAKTLNHFFQGKTHAQVIYKWLFGQKAFDKIMASWV